MKKNLKEIPVSILDLANIIQGDQSAGDAFKRSLTFAQHAEQLGYKRYWFAEHHNMESVASAATALLVGYIAQGTSTIRVGAGGIMLPNHAPLIIAEQFGTLESLYPGRIDLGLGRAPGTDQPTAYALRRNLNGDVDAFPNDVVELLQYFGPQEKQGKVRAIPGVGTNVPVWMLAPVHSVPSSPPALDCHLRLLLILRQHNFFPPFSFIVQRLNHPLFCKNLIAWPA